MFKIKTSTLKRDLLCTAVDYETMLTIDKGNERYCWTSVKVCYEKIFFYKFQTKIETILHVD